MPTLLTVEERDWRIESLRRQVAEMDRLLTEVRERERAIVESRVRAIATLERLLEHDGLTPG
jgi:hypothetical protein